MEAALFLTVCLCAVGLSNGKFALILDTFKNCPKYNNLPIFYHEAEIIMKNGFQLFLNYNITVRSTVKEPLESKWVIEKCSSKESLDSCSQFYTFRTGEYCKFLSARGEFWSSFVDCVTPKLQCPFKKGKYYAKNCTLDFSLFKMFPLQEGYWKCNIMVSDKTKKKTLKACTSVAGGIRRNNKS